MLPDTQTFCVNRMKEKKFERENFIPVSYCPGIFHVAFRLFGNGTRTDSDAA